MPVEEVRVRWGRAKRVRRRERRRPVGPEPRTVRGVEREGGGMTED